jgi:hypothetical protein
MKIADYKDLITQTEAARIRNVSPEAVGDLVRRGRLAVVEVGGKKFVRRSDVASFKPLRGGRPSKKVSKKGKRK